MLISDGSSANEIWIKTPNDGNNHKWTTNVYQYYTSLANYHLYPAEIGQLEFSAKVYGGTCSNRFIMLSNAENLNSPMFYEIYFGDNTFAIRKYDIPGDAYANSPPSYPIGNCTTFVGFFMKWTAGGNFRIYTADGEFLGEWNDPNPFDINGVGIKSGFGDEGIWRVKHLGEYRGLVNESVLRSMLGKLHLKMIISQILVLSHDLRLS